MIESYVDLQYRGLPLARRVKLTSVRPREGYVEMAAPMPVGTAIRLATDEGVAIDARVIAVTEQPASAPDAPPPGMQIEPVLDGAAGSWWAVRVALPDAPPAPKRMVIQATQPVAIPAAVLAPPPPSNTALAPAAPHVAAGPPAGKREPTLLDTMATIPMPVIGDDELEADQGKRTVVMDAVVAEELLELVAADSNPRMPPVIVDDGQRTQVMEAVDLSALGLDTNASGSLRAITQTDPEGDESKPNAAGKKKRKRRP